VHALLLATWRNGLRSGLQSRLSEFDSRRRLHLMSEAIASDTAS
jgi:hypothetical protein